MIILEIIKFIQSFSSPFLDKFFELATIFGEEYIYIFILGIIFWCIDKKYGYKLAFAFLFSSVINNFIKNVFKAPRPLNIDSIRHLSLETATGYSFPSGHTQNISSFFASIIKKYKKIGLYIVGIIFVFLVGVSRIYLGVHWPKDIIGGIFLGVLCVFLSDYIFDYVDNSRNKYILLLMITPVIIFMIIFNDSSDLFKAAGIYSSFYIGYIIEDKYIKFTVKEKIWKQIIKFTLGIAVVLILKTLLKTFLPNIILSDFIRYFIMGIWITVIAPVIFRAFNLSKDEFHYINNGKNFDL